MQFGETAGDGGRRFAFAQSLENVGLFERIGQGRSLSLLLPREQFPDLM